MLTGSRSNVDFVVDRKLLRASRSTGQSVSFACGWYHLLLIIVIAPSRNALDLLRGFSALPKRAMSPKITLTQR